MAIETKGNGSKTTYLQLDFGRKNMYIYSGEEKEGFEKHTSDKGKVTYRQYVNAISGVITAAYFRDGNFGKEFALVLTDGDERYNLSLGIDGSLFQSLARSIKNIDISKKIRLAVYENKGQNGDKSYFALSLTYPEDLDENGKAKFIEWGDELPKGKQLRTGKWDFSEALDEAYGRIEEFINSNDFDKQNDQVSNSKPTSDKKDEGVKDTQDDEDEDLPF